MTQNNRPIPGSLKERDGKYTAILNVYDETGKRKQKTACSAYSGERQQAKGAGRAG